jgi:hypothetical protein
MKNKPLDLIKELSSHPENFTPEQMSVFVKSSLAFFNEFQETAKSGDEKAIEKALQELKEFTEALQEMTKKAAEKSGLTPEQMVDFVHNPSNFSKEDFAAMKELNEHINSFNTSIIKEFYPQIKKGANKSKRVAKNEQLQV